MSLFQIKHRITGNVLFERDCDSMRICVEAAVESRAYLADANLAGANLADAYLARANLARVYLAQARHFRERGATGRRFAIVLQGWAANARRRAAAEPVQRVKPSKAAQDRLRLFIVAGYP